MEEPKNNKVIGYRITTQAQRHNGAPGFLVLGIEDREWALEEYKNWVYDNTDEAVWVRDGYPAGEEGFKEYVEGGDLKAEEIFEYELESVLEKTLPGDVVDFRRE